MVPCQGFTGAKHCTSGSDCLPQRIYNTTYKTKHLVFQMESKLLWGCHINFYELLQFVMHLWFYPYTPNHHGASQLLLLTSDLDFYFTDFLYYRIPHQLHTGTEINPGQVMHLWPPSRSVTRTAREAPGSQLCTLYSQQPWASQEEKIYNIWRWPANKPFLNQSNPFKYLLLWIYWLVLLFHFLGASVKTSAGSALWDRDWLVAIDFTLGFMSKT